MLCKGITLQRTYSANNSRGYHSEYKYSHRMGQFNRMTLGRGDESWKEKINWWEKDTKKKVMLL